MACYTYENYGPSESDNDRFSAISFLNRINPTIRGDENAVVILCGICRGLPTSQIEAIDGLKASYLKHLFQDLEKASNEIKRMCL